MVSASRFRTSRLIFRRFLGAGCTAAVAGAGGVAGAGTFAVLFGRRPRLFGALPSSDCTCLI